MFYLSISMLEESKETTDLPKVTDKLNHIYLYQVQLSMSELKLWVRIPLMGMCTLYNVMW